MLYSKDRHMFIKSAAGIYGLHEALEAYAHVIGPET